MAFQLATFETTTYVYKEVNLTFLGSLQFKVFVYYKYVNKFPSKVFHSGFSSVKMK